VAGLARHPRDAGRVDSGLGIAQQAAFDELGLSEHDGQRRAQVVRGRRQELLLQPSGVLARPKLAGMRGERPGLEQDPGLVGEELQEPEVVLDEDRRAGRVHGEHPEPAFVHRHGRGDHGARTGVRVDLRMLGIGPHGVHGDPPALGHERVPTDERVAGVLHPLAVASDVAQHGPIRIRDADRRTACAEGVGGRLLELLDGLAIVSDAGEMNRALQEGPQVRLAPGATDPGRRREAEEEGEDRCQRAGLDDRVEQRVLVLCQALDEGDDDDADEHDRPRRDGGHAPLGDPARPSGLARERERGVAADRDEPRHRHDQGHRRRLAAGGQDGPGDGHEHRCADDLDPPWRATEVVDQPDHREGRDVEHQEHSAGDPGSRDAEELDRACQHHDQRDRAEEEHGVHPRARRLAQGMPQDGHEEADEQALGHQADQLECGHPDHGTGVAG
jgi:hypothetical protein